MTFFNKKYFFCVLIILFLSGCSNLGFVSFKTANGEEPKDEKINTDEEIATIQEPIIKPIDMKSDHVSFVYTTKKQLSLTFNGMSDASTMEEILETLDFHKIKATFFVSANKVEEFPEIAEEIISRGHEIENNSLEQQDLTNLSYEEIYNAILESNTIIEEQTGTIPKYIRVTTVTENEDILIATAHVGLTAAVTDGVNLHDWDMKSSSSFKEFIASGAKRGSILTANVENPDIFTAIPIVAEVIANSGYEFVPLNQLMESSYERNKLEDIPGYNVVRKNSYDTFYNEIERMDTDKKQVALTFNNWGSEQTITNILDILKDSQVTGTFFIDPVAAENNPNLARTIVENGNDIGIRTYSPIDITQVSKQVLQEELIKGFQVLTMAIQKQTAMYFRPDYGIIDKESSQIVATTGIKNIALHDVDSKDWEQATTYEIVTNVLEDVQEGSIILLHLQDNLNTVDALPMIITELRNRGYNIVKLGDI
ncbi:polysaccharide deacetylase family protein [Radiobacillus sp. PE A8.2]|uniref:polysaccharide deacetylase family protein n=1 Tax=Radiobacillus sp. PE A8.2 TaxID=3380349 RepID=UPI00388E2DFB